MAKREDMAKVEEEGDLSPESAWEARGRYTPCVFM
jgi:hypothetical protein